jgi:hypothetical protein
MLRAVDVPPASSLGLAQNKADFQSLHVVASIWDLKSIQASFI